MATFVLVPGAWLGGWCWQRVTPLLEAQGHRVLTPTLTGLGERTHLLSDAVDLETHIQDVVNVMRWEEARDVILVGHSYAGFVVTGVAHRAPDWISSLVYLDTSVPGNGEACFAGWSPEGRAAIEAEATTHGGWLMPEDLGGDAADVSPQDMAWMRSKATPHPIGTLSQPLSLDNAHVTPVKHGYLACTPAREQFADYLRPYRDDPAWQFVDIESGHWPMFSAPEALAAGLLQLAESNVRS